MKEVSTGQELDCFWRPIPPCLYRSFLKDRPGLVQGDFSAGETLQVSDIIRLAGHKSGAS